MKLDYDLYQTDEFTEVLKGTLHAGTGEQRLYFKFRYTPPYDKFTVLKELQLAERAMNPFGDRMLIAGDMTDWLGHEQEEYFDVLCKYLTDMRCRWDYAFKVSSSDRDAIGRLHLKMRMYMKGALHRDEFAENKKDILTVIGESPVYTLPAAYALASFFTADAFRGKDVYELFERVTEEIVSECDSLPVTLEAVEAYADDPDSIIRLICNGKVPKIRSDFDER